MKEGVEKEVMSAVEWIRIEAKEPRETDAAGVGVNWKAASEALSSEADINPSGESGVGVNRKGSLETRMASASGEVIQETCRHRGQRWDCSQIEDESEEGCDGLARG